MSTILIETATTPITALGPSCGHDNRVTAAVETAHLRLSGALDSFPRKQITPTMGTEFLNVNIHAMIRAPNADELIKDLAIIVSERGFCVFRKQSLLTLADQKLLAHRLGQLTTRPSTSGLYIHPINHMVYEDGTMDLELMSPSRDPNKKLYTREAGFSKMSNSSQSRADGWHTDGSYESVPPDYTLLHMVKVPQEGSGGDTMFASSYEAYDLLSPTMKKFFEGLSVTFMPPDHTPEKIEGHMWKGTRGAPENYGAHLRATHPAIRTNPVTGWKSLNAFSHHLEKFEGLGDVENQILKDFVTRLVTQNHQLQARVRWEQDDLVVWDNRAVFHSATYDYGGFAGGKRIGNRVCGVGEIPYLDPKSTGRRQALELE